MQNRSTRVNKNKMEVTISGERQKMMQKAVRWPCGVCDRGVNTVCCLSEVGTQEMLWFKG